MKYMAMRLLSNNLFAKGQARERLMVLDHCASLLWSQWAMFEVGAMQLTLEQIIIEFNL